MLFLCFTCCNLARMGNTRDALRLIMSQLNDIDQAIEFCKTYDDPELWEQLIGHSLAKPGNLLNSNRCIQLIQLCK